MTCIADTSLLARKRIRAKPALVRLMGLFSSLRLPARPSPVSDEIIKAITGFFRVDGFRPTTGDPSWPIQPTRSREEIWNTRSACARSVESFCWFFYAPTNFLLKGFLAASSARSLTRVAQLYPMQL
jgi:hypothetical protein